MPSGLRRFLRRKNRNPQMLDMPAWLIVDDFLSFVDQTSSKNRQNVARPTCPKFGGLRFSGGKTAGGRWAPKHMAFNAHRLHAHRRHAHRLHADCLHADQPKPGPSKIMVLGLIGRLMAPNGISRPSPGRELRAGADGGGGLAPTPAWIAPTPTRKLSGIA